MVGTSPRHHHDRLGEPLEPRLVGPSLEGARRLIAPHLIVRADGGPGVGNGHLARCLALTQAWVDRDGKATLVSHSLPTFWAERYRREGVDICRPRSGSLNQGDWAVIDGYSLGLDAERSARNGAPRVMALDDYGAGGDHEADIVLDQNLGASRSAYAGIAANPDLLLGPRYSLLRREFRAAHSRARTTPVVASRLLVALGGAPPAGALAIVEQVLNDPAFEGLEIQVLDGVDDVPAAMARADFALSASGSICWELCCTGLPAVLLAIADNQVPVAAAMARSGAASWPGIAAEPTAAELVAAVARLRASPIDREAMTRHGRSLVDGRGARRVVTRMRGDLLSLRPATAADGPLLWQWVNDKAVRAAAFNGDAIDRESHDVWFAARLIDPCTRIYLATAGNSAPIGQARFEGDEESAEMDVSVSSAARYRGWGPALIDAAVRRFFADAKTSVVYARIKEENAASLSAFDDANFTYEPSAVDGPIGSIRSFRRRDLNA